MIYKKIKFNKKKALTITCLSVIVLFTFANGFLYLISPFLNSDKYLKETEPKSSDFWNIVGTSISIDNNWTATNTTYDWCNGAGTVGDPYIIENVTLDAQNSGSCILIENSIDYFIIRNCTLIDGGESSLDSGIKLVTVQNGLIQNNTCYNARCGIVVQSSSDIIVRENVVYGSSFVGIYMYFGSFNDAINNKITGSSRGLSIYDASNMNFSQNVLENTGIHVYYNAESQLTTNYIDTSNLVSGKPVYFYTNEDNLGNSNFTDPGQIILVNCNDCSLSGFDLKNTNIGMQLLFCDNAQVFGNNLTDNSLFGIIVREGNYNNINNNYLRSNMYGIDLYDTCLNNTIENNLFEACGTGVNLNLNSEHNTLVNNNFTQCSTGIRVVDCANNIIESNSVIDSNNGMYLNTGSSNNHFIRNKIEGSTSNGIYLSSNGDSNEFRENVIKDSGNAGVYITSSDCENNIFIQNSFMQNTRHVNDVGTDNYYNNSVIGNYWDNYTGIDANDDRIGDTAHLVQTSTMIYDYLPIWHDGFDIPIPIHVNNNWTETVATYDWVTGSGIWSDPYLIEDITIDAQGSGSGILIENTDDYFIIRNCTIYDVPSWNYVTEGYDAGIKLDNTDNGRIYNNTIYDTEYASIYLEGADNNTIYENILYQNVLWGIDNHWCYNNQIINNTVSANFVDIGFYNCENMTLRDNQMQLSGFYFRASTLLQANSHYIPLSNVLNGKMLYYYKNLDYLSSTDFQNPAQIILVNCHNSSISDIEFSHAYRTIDLYYSDDNTIQNCNFTFSNDKNIQLIHSEGNIIQNNRFGDGNSVVLDDYSSYNIVRNNIFLGSKSFSIEVMDYSSYNQIYDNTIDGGSRGVYLISHAISNEVFRNNISNLFLYGIYIMGYSSLNHVYDNTVTNCDREGIRVERSASNVIRENRIVSNELGVLFYSDSNLNGCYNNTLLSNVKHAQDDGVNNFWNITTIGNYWDNYTGVDANDNLIGDIAHPIAGSAASFDYLPIWEDGDDLGPMISITSPSIDSYHINSPTIQVSITDPSEVNETWYTVIGSGINHTFTGTSFEVNLTSWMNHVNGPIIIRIYANDTFGNLAFADLSINKDTINPQILINEPVGGTEFGVDPPSFNLTINESNISQLWFQINDSSTSHFISVVSGNNVFTMDSSVWDAISDGHVLISFYANDTAGNTGTTNITIIKDTINPPILLNQPLGGTEFGDDPPSFNLTINESNISQLWFKINDSSTSHFISVVSGNNVFTMDSSIWDAISDGHVLISFYANDTAGNTGTTSVTIIKDTSTSPPPGPPQGIPGYDLGFLISLISIISVMIIAKRRNLLD